MMLFKKVWFTEKYRLRSLQLQKCLGCLFQLASDSLHSLFIQDSFKALTLLGQ